MAIASQKSTFGFVEEIDVNELEFGQVVGRGAFGIVQKAHWRGLTVAVKQIETENEKRAFVQELKQLSRVSHENIVKLYGASTKFPVFLVMEFAECGSLYNLLHGNEPVVKYAAAHAVCWSLQTALGVTYLHNMKPKAIIHRDLKPPNLLLVKKGTVVKICDFGTAADIQTHMTNNKGSAAWMAPEVFEGNRYSEKCDVFSWGIVLWECLARKKPFDEVGGPAFRIMWAIHSGTRPPLLKNMPKVLERLMTRCWSKNPAERPSMDEVVRIMMEVMPLYKDKFTPLVFPGFFLEDDGKEPQSSSNGSESLRIDDILNTSTSPIDTPDRPRGSSISTPGSRPISHRDSEEVQMEDIEIDAPLISVEETERPSLRSINSMSSMTAKTDQGAQAASTTAGNTYSPRNIVKTSNAQMKRFSADGDQLAPMLQNLTITETPQPAPRRKNFGHRRVGSHGNPPIQLDPPPPQTTQAQFTRMTTSASHPGDLAPDLSAHQNLNHSRSWAADSHMMAAAPRNYIHGRPTSEPQSTPTPPPSFPQMDDSLKPLQPLQSSNQSMLIYYEHVAMAEKYIAVQHKSAALRARIGDLKIQLEEQREIKEKNRQLMETFQRLTDENEGLMKIKQSTEQQQLTRALS